MGWALPQVTGLAAFRVKMVRVFEFMPLQIAESARLAVRSACMARPAQMTWFCTLKPTAADDLTAA
jgi:hypothetical protein